MVLPIYFLSFQFATRISVAKKEGTMHRYVNSMDEINALASVYKQNGGFAPELYEKYDVKRGLRDKDGTGVVVGLTTVSDIRSKKIVDGKKSPHRGRIVLQGIRRKRYHQA
jgi:hypothetical protein